jgi:hypothetical protein
MKHLLFALRIVAALFIRRPVHFVLHNNWISPRNITFKRRLIIISYICTRYEFHECDNHQRFLWRSYCARKKRTPLHIPTETESPTWDYFGHSYTSKRGHWMPGVTDSSFISFFKRFQPDHRRKNRSWLFSCSSSFKTKYAERASFKKLPNVKSIWKRMKIQKHSVTLFSLISQLDSTHGERISADFTVITLRDYSKRIDSDQTCTFHQPWQIMSDIGYRAVKIEHELQKPPVRLYHLHLLLFLIMKPCYWRHFLRCVGNDIYRRQISYVNRLIFVYSMSLKFSRVNTPL